MSETFARLFEPSFRVRLQTKTQWHVLCGYLINANVIQHFHIYSVIIVCNVRRINYLLLLLALLYSGNWHV